MNIPLDQYGYSADCFAIACRAMDGAYDGGPTRDLLAERFGPKVEVKIPPPKNAIFSLNAAQYPTVRDHYIVETRHMGAWPGRKPPATISAAALKLSLS